MKILLMHSKDTWYKAVEPAIDNPPDEPKEENIGESVVAFISVESEDGSSEIELAIKEILEHAKRVKIKKILIYPFAHLSQDLAPPRKAHDILVKLEEKLKKMPDYDVHRAPFGWYKSFRVFCAGHPMCELSRTLRSKISMQKAFYLDKEGKAMTVSEAARKGYLPTEFENRKVWDQKAIELFERFSVYPNLKDMGHVLINEIRKWSLVVLGAKEYTFSGGTGRSSLTKDLDQEIFFILKDVLDTVRYGVKEPIIKTTNVPGEEIVISSLNNSNIDPSIFDDLMSEISSHIIELKVGRNGLTISYDLEFNGAMLFYKTRARGLVPIGGSLKVRGFQGVFLGPLLNIIKSLLDHGLRLAEEGKTPQFPFWLAPFQVAIIPVREENMSYSIMIKNSIENLARVYLDPPTRSLGTRIRTAARLWTPYIVVVGSKEAQSNTVTVRRRGKREQETMSLEAFIEELSVLRSNSPRIELNPLSS